MAQRRTILLVILLGVTCLTAALAYGRLSTLRETAQTGAENQALARRDIEDIRRWRASPGRAAPVLADTPELTRRLREAATAAGLAEPPGSEPDNPKPIADSDYSEMLVFLHFQPLTIRQLTTFLHTLSRIDPSSRAKTIELRPPDATAPPAPPGEELWTADVSVGYLTYTPRPTR
jgi:hypothetical protein